MYPILGTGQEFALRLLKRRSVLYWGALFIAAVAEIVIWQPAYWRLATLFVWGAVALVAFVLGSRSNRPVGWWHTMFRPLFFATWTLGLILFVGSGGTRQILVIALAGLLILFWENVWRFYWAPERYNQEAIENVSIALNTVTVWFAGQLFYTLLPDPSIIQFPSGLVTEFIRNHIILASTAIFLVSVFLMDYRTVWVLRYDQQRVRLLLITTSLIMGEIFWVLNFLPHRVEVKSFLLVLAYYLFTNLGRAHLDGNLRPAILRRYIYLSVGSLVLVLLSSRWLI